jgi:Alpha/beta hydrolase domain
MRRTLAGLVTLLALVVITGACSSDDDAGGETGDSGGEDRAAPEEVERPDGPAATVGGPLEGGQGMWLASAGGGPTLDEAGYEEAEYSASGTATSYASAEPLPTDGTYALEPAGEADYATRIVVRRPTDPDAFNGTVAVEWLNVSSGADAAPDYTYLADELLREGYAWVGVSAQRIGIEGGEIAVSVPGAEGLGLGDGLRARDPERYGDLHHPGDAFSYDIYTQVARALRSPGEVDPLDGLDVERLLAVGESQSAFTLTTYVNGVQPLTRQFDGFLVHSRGAASAPLGQPDAGIDIAGTLGGPLTTIRADNETPVIVVQTETEVLGLFGYLAARQPDDDHFRLWEIAGTAHADTFQLGDTEEMLGCAQQVNAGQQVFVLRAALRHLDTWAADGTAPPEAPRLDVDEAAAPPSFLLDDVGNVTGGIRSPVVDAPVDVLSGIAPADATIICLLMGSTTPIGADRLAQLYPTGDDYLAAYEDATDAMIDAGFALPEDREQILEDADPTRLPT